MDQSMVFDGGWRILLGQVPYRDFYMPFGPVTFYLQAFFFTLFGVNFTATVISAATMNLLATAVVMRILNVQYPGYRAAELAGGVLTAVAFQAIFGTLWLEQTAWFFSLVSLWLCFEAAPTIAATRRAGLLFLSGVAVVAAVLSKQNVGGLMALLWVPAVVLSASSGSLRQRVRTLLYASCGVVAAAGGYWLVLNLTSSVAGFQHNWVEVASSIGRSRSEPFKLLLAILLQTFPEGTAWLAWAGAAVGSLCLLAKREANADREQSRMASAVLTIGVVMAMSLASAMTYNERENAIPLIGLVLGAALGVLRPFVPEPKVFVAIATEKRRNLLAMLVIGSAATTICVLSAAGLSRKVHQFQNATFGEKVDVPGFDRVRWISRGISPTSIPARDFEAVARALRGSKTFFIMGECTMLYGALSVAPPQRYLYFLSGHSFLESEADAAEAGTLASLRASAPEMVVVETETYNGSQLQTFQRMRALQNWVATGYELVQTHGIFGVYRRKPSS